VQADIMGEHQLDDGAPELAALPLERLCEEILERHHAYAHIAVPRIRGQLAAALEREPDSLPVALPGTFAALADRLLSHLAKEENILFPAVTSMAEAERSGRGRPLLPFPTLLHPIRVMEAEHARLAEALDELTVVASGFIAGEGASDSTRRLMAELATFRDHLAAHLRTENDVLFPRALELDRRL
jgi:regulator of cell morphogenesis and NO signaling